MLVLLSITKAPKSENSTVQFSLEQRMDPHPLWSQRKCTVPFPVKMYVVFVSTCPFIPCRISTS